MDEKKILRKQISGVVVSDKMDKTVVVLSSKYSKSKIYGKYLSRRKKYKAHDENNEYKIGDKVVIEECRPISKDKKFKVIKKV